jgi:hypothetical protein
MPGAPTVSTALQEMLDKGVLDPLPTSFSAFFFDQVKAWNLLFPAEKNYFERLVALLGRSDPTQLDLVFAPLRNVERRMGVNESIWPERQFTLKQIDFLNRSPFYQEWRRAVQIVFAHIDPILEEEIASRGKARLVIVTAPSEIPAAVDRMWLRIRQRGLRVPLDVDSDEKYYLQKLLTGGSGNSLTGRYAKDPYGAWAISAGHVSNAGPGTVKLGYENLKDYRSRLMAEVDRLVEGGSLRGPQELEQRLKQLQIHDREAEFAADPVLAEFAREVLLNGNGTLLVNNTFVEWATIQAARRARPSVLIVSFGVRNKLKPFSSLLIYADQEKSSPVPTQMDTLGTYVDLEIFYQYLWQEFEKYGEYRNNTAYLFVVDGFEELLCIGPRDFPLFASAQGTVGLQRVFDCATEWLGI